MNSYVYRPEITFEQTNIVGNIYFVHFVRWQGACRELFLRAHCPAVLDQIVTGELILHTSSVSCDFQDVTGARLDDTIAVHMTLAAFRGGRLTMDFRYTRESEQGEDRIAVGSQCVCCKGIVNGKITGRVFPLVMLWALREYANTDELRNSIDDAIEFQGDQLAMSAPRHSAQSLSAAR